VSVRDGAGFANLQAIIPERPAVLIVEDDEATATALSRQLVGLGYTAQIATSAEQADPWIANQRFDLVLLDVNLPRMNGMEFLGWILRRSPTTAVVMVTGNDDIDMAIECLEQGARTYLVKPIEPEVLRLSVRDALAVSALMQHWVASGR
jgi:DNA-binding response OmpR family regulator